MARVALDAMGGDFAPRATVAGALLALADLPPEHTIQLVGRSEIVERGVDDRSLSDQLQRVLTLQLGEREERAGDCRPGSEVAPHRVQRDTRQGQASWLATRSSPA